MIVDLSFKKLRSLYTVLDCLDQNNIEAVSVTSLNLSRNPNLDFLDLDQFPTFPNVTSLNLSICALDSQRLSTLAPFLEKFPNLRNLEIQHNKISSVEDLQILRGSLVACPFLETLDLRETPALTKTNAIPVVTGIALDHRLTKLFLDPERLVSAGMHDRIKEKCAGVKILGKIGDKEIKYTRSDEVAQASAESLSDVTLGASKPRQK